MLDAAGFKRCNDTNHVFMGLIDDRRYGIAPTTNCLLVASDSAVMSVELLAGVKPMSLLINLVARETIRLYSY
jgi:hypothetical protein